MIAAFLTVLLVPSCPANGGPLQREQREVRAILDSADPELAEAELSARLARLGKAAIPELFSALALAPDEPVNASEREERVVLEALASLPVEDLRAYFRSRLKSGLSMDERRALLDVLERVGSAQDLSLAYSVAQVGAEAGGLAAGLESLVARLLGDDPQGLATVRRWILLAPPELCSALIRGVGRSACPSALAMLVDLLGRQPDLDRELLPEVALLCVRRSGPPEGEIVSVVAEFLWSDDPFLLREALVALGALEDFQSTPRMIELLDHPDRGVRAASLGALESLSGLRFGAGAARWRAWHRAESSWFDEHRERLADELRSDAPEVAVKALGEISQHRFRRHESARSVTEALAHPDLRVRRLACLTLGRLGSIGTIEALEQALEDPQEEVRAAARAALDLLLSTQVQA